MNQSFGTVKLIGMLQRKLAQTDTSQVVFEQSLQSVSTKVLQASYRLTEQFYLPVERVLEMQQS